MADLPVVCSLTPESLRARREGLLTDLLRQAQGREDLVHGVRLRFAPSADVLWTITRAIEAERHCCRFLRFRVIVEPDGGGFFVELDGPPGTREFVAGLLDA